MTLKVAIEIYDTTGLENGLPRRWSEVETPSDLVRYSDIIKCMFAAFAR